jgi:PE family protein
MSYVIAAPEMLAAAAGDLATIDSSLSAAHTAAAAPTVALVPAAADEVSASIAHLFSQHAEDYQAVAGQAAAFHQQFIQNLNASARSYASTEAANTLSLRSLDASTGSHASANAGAQNQSLWPLVPVQVLWPLVPVQVPFEEPLVLLLLLLTFQWELALPLLSLIRYWPTPVF